MAVRHNLPIVIHCRNDEGHGGNNQAELDCFDIMTQVCARNCFSLPFLSRVLSNFFWGFFSEDFFWGFFLRIFSDFFWGFFLIFSEDFSEDFFFSMFLMIGRSIVTVSADPSGRPQSGWITFLRWPLASLPASGAIRIWWRVTRWSSCRWTVSCWRPTRPITPRQLYVDLLFFYKKNVTSHSCLRNSLTIYRLYRVCRELYGGQVRFSISDE